jgi:hypothetical protein
VLSLHVRNQHTTHTCIYDPQLISVIENDKSQIRSACGWRQSQRDGAGAIGIDQVRALRCSVRKNRAIQTNRGGLLDAALAVKLDYSDFRDQPDRPERNNRSCGGDGIAPFKRLRSAVRYREIRVGTARTERIEVNCDLNEKLRLPLVLIMQLRTQFPVWYFRVTLTPPEEMRTSGHRANRRRPRILHLVGANVQEAAKQSNAMANTRSTRAKSFEQMKITRPDRKKEKRVDGGIRLW